MVLLAPAAIGPGLTQVTICPLVVQVLPLLLKEAGADTPVGKVTVVVIGPVVVAVPLLVTVTGRLLLMVACSAGAGWPIAVTKSGTAQLAANPLGPA